jgi:capsular exopolysaccharide synthesis family protein
LNDNQVEISARGKDIVTYSFQTKTEIERLEKLSIEETVPLGEEITSHYYRFKIVPNENFSFDDIAGKSYYFTINNLGAMANFYKEELNLSLYNEQSTVAIVDLLVNNTPKGIQFLNSLTQEYIKQNLSKKNQMAEATIDYINNQLDMISDSLSIAEEKLQEFRTRYQVHNLDTKAEQIFAQLQILQSEKATLTVKQRYYESIKERFDSNEEVSDLIAPSSMGIDDPLLGNLVAEFAELNSQKVTLIDNSQERSPYLKSLEIKIANLRNTIYENIKYNLNTNEFTLENLNSRISRLNNELSSMPATERQLMGIQREFNLQDEVYNFLLQRRAEAQIAKASNFPTVEVVEPPRRIGRTAVLPKKKANYLLGIIIGLLIPLSILLLRILIRNVVSSYDEVVSVSKLPRIGNVVHQKDLKDKHIIFNEPDAPISESFRKVIANMRYLKVNPKQLTILVTSSIAGEGKSFIAYNLASAFAMQKRKTILLSFDMRKPDFYEDLGFQMEEGMSTVVSSRTDVDKATVNTSNPFLTIIPPGPTPPNPSELIASAETAKLINQLKTSNEVVIIDTPPAGLLADASYLMDLVNINLYVVRIGHTPRSIFRTTIQEMKSKDIENLCLLVNGMPPDKKGYGYHSSYYKPDRKTRRRRARKKKADKKKNA